MAATRRSHYIAAMSESTRAPEQRLRPFAGFPEELVSEILLSLPPKSILRCRAVCKDWRRITSDDAFLLAHHHRQQPRRLLSFVRDVGPRRDLDYCIETLDLHTNQLRSVVRFTDSGLSHYDDSPFKVYAACDGLLLMSYYTRLHLWNPATRQWCSAYPPALQHDTIMGLYAHGCPHSREYRVLYYRSIGVAPTFYINTVGTENERVIWPETSSGSVTQWLQREPLNLRLDKPCLFSSNLHWPPCSTGLKCLLVFDTVAEVFQWLQGPTELGHMTWLLEMEGTLAISSSNIGGSEVDLWLLQDYKSAIWVHKYRIKLPVLEIRRFDPEFISPEGDVLVDKDGETDAYWFSQVVSPEGDVLVDVGGFLLHYDIKGNMLQKFHCDGRMLNFTTHILQESLVPHTFFRAQGDGNVEEPPFFRWL